MPVTRVTAMSINGTVMTSYWQFYCVSVGLPCILFLLDFLYMLKVSEALLHVRTELITRVLWYFIASQTNLAA